MTTILLCSAVLSAGSVAYFSRLARSPFERVPTSPYTLVDAVFTLVLAGFFLLNIVSHPGTPIVVTRDLLVMTSLLWMTFIIIICSVLIVRGRNPIRLFGLHWKEWKPGLRAAGLTLLAALPVVIFLHQLAVLIIGPDARPQEILEFLYTHPELADRLTVATMAVVVAPLSEELVFRGYLYGVTKKFGGPWCAIGVSSLLFAAVHMNSAAFLALAGLGVALCLLYERTGSLWAPVLVHVGFNATMLASSLLWPAELP